MAACKDCLHYEACVLNEAYWVKHNADQACHAFKDKSKYVEQKQGEWVVCGDGEYVPFMCSACGKTTSWYHKQTAKYCPNCGAKMDDV